MTNPDFERPEVELKSSRYEILGERIGRGAWGDVYRAYDKWERRMIALKVMNPSPSAMRQLLPGTTLEDVVAQEALMTKEPNLVSRHADRDEGGTYLLTSELYDRTLPMFLEELRNSPRQSWFGKSERDRIYSSGLSLDQIVSVGRQVFAAVEQYQRVTGNSYRDLKPENFVVDKNNTVLLTDFGTAAATVNAVQPDIALLARGHIFTRSPRSWIEPNVPHRSSDVYALGSWVSYLFTGKFLFEKELALCSEGEGREFMSPLQAAEVLRSRLEGEKDLEELPREFYTLLENLAAADDPATYARIDAKGALGRLENAKNDFEARVSKQESYRRKIASVVETSIGGVKVLSKLALVVGGMTLLGRLGYEIFKSKPSSDQRPQMVLSTYDFEMPRLEEDKVTFHLSTSLAVPVPQAKNTLLKVPDYSIGAETLNDTLVALIYKTAADLDVIVDERGAQFRYQLRRKEHVTPPLRVFQRYVKDLMPEYQVAPNVVSADGFFGALLFGENRYRVRELMKQYYGAGFHQPLIALPWDSVFTVGASTAVRRSFSVDSSWAVYGSERQETREINFPVIGEQRNEFIRQLSYNLQTFLPGRIAKRGG